MTKKIFDMAIEIASRWLFFTKMHQTIPYQYCTMKARNGNFPRFQDWRNQLDRFIFTSPLSWIKLANSVIPDVPVRG